MTNYSDAMTMREARDRYFEENGFGRGYDDKWVKFFIGPLPVIFPNTAARARAAQLHDLHHVATEYQTDLPGEAEIGAWEIARGCGPYLPAWSLNGLALLMGPIIAPRRTLRAFVRGLRSRNLYDREFSDALLDKTVGEIRKELGLDRELGAISAAEMARFALTYYGFVMAFWTGLLPVFATLSLYTPRAFERKFL